MKRARLRKLKKGMQRNNCDVNVNLLQFIGFLSRFQWACRQVLHHLVNRVESSLDRRTMGSRPVGRGSLAQLSADRLPVGTSSSIWMEKTSFFLFLDLTNTDSRSGKYLHMNQNMNIPIETRENIRCFILASSRNLSLKSYPYQICWKKESLSESVDKAFCTSLSLGELGQAYIDLFSFPLWFLQLSFLHFAFRWP